MKKYIFLILVVAVSSLNSFSQEGIRGGRANHNNHNFDIEDFKKKKSDYIISEAKLTQSEAEQFLPLMDELLQKRFDINRKVRKASRALKDKTNPSDQEYDNYLKLHLQSEIDLAELDKEYYQKFSKVLSSEKIYKSKRAEKKFMKETINRNSK